MTSALQILITDLVQQVGPYTRYTSSTGQHLTDLVHQVRPYLDTSSRDRNLKREWNRAIDASKKFLQKRRVGDIARFAG